MKDYSKAAFGFFGIVFAAFWGVSSISYVCAESDNRHFSEDLPQQTLVPTNIRGSLSYANATPLVIIKPGTYKVTDAMSASGTNVVTISASNVVLDLDGKTLSNGTNGIVISGDNVTVKNGTIQDASQYGIYITGSQCSIENIDVIGTATGFESSGGDTTRFSNCRALNNISAGFSFVSSSTNICARCQAIDQSGSANVYGFVSDGGSANTFDQCVAKGCATSTTNSGYYAAGFVLKNSEDNSTIINSNATGIHASVAAGGAYGIYVPSGSTDLTIKNNTVSKITSVAASGIGIRVDSSVNYVAGNSSCDSDSNYQDVATELISSQANSRGVDNIDCSLTTPDTVEVIDSKVDIVADETWSIESKSEVISSKIDDLKDTSVDYLFTIESKIDNLDLNVTATVDLTTVDSKLDIVVDESWSIESKCELIISKIDNLCIDITCTIDMTAIGKELWSIESKAEVISSKIDDLDDDVLDGDTSIYSKLIDIETDISESSCSVTSISGPREVGSGSYCLSKDIGDGTSTVLTVTDDNVSIDFNGHTVNGKVVINDGIANVVFKNGNICGNNNVSPALSCTGSCSCISIDTMKICSATIAVGFSGMVTNLRVLNSVIGEYGTHGLFIDTVSSVVIHDSLFIDSNYTGTGVAISYGSGIDIRTTDFKQNLHGIYIGSSGDVLNTIRIDTCFLSTCSLSGITLENCRAVEVLNSEVTRCLDYYYGQGVNIIGGCSVTCDHVMVSGFRIGFAQRDELNCGTLRECIARGNLRGFYVAPSVVSILKSCIAMGNGPNNSEGCGFQGVAAGATSLTWFVSNMASGNGEYPAQKTPPYDSNYCTGLDTATPTKTNPNGSKAPFYQLTRDNSSIQYWDNLSASFTCQDDV